MSIRLDPRRVNALKHLAGEAGVRPGDLVRQWVEERLDSSRGSVNVAPGAPAENVLNRLEALTARVAALESMKAAEAPPPPAAQAAEPAEPATAEASGPSAENESAAEAPRPRGTKRVSAAPSGDRVALHDEMIAVLRENGPLPAADVAAAIVERGRYTVPRSGKPIDAKTVSQRVSNPTYRALFVRREGRIGLAEEV